MRRATIALLIALATMFGGSAAGASTGSPLGLDQSQVGNNTNQTGQQSKATASTDQLNLNIPISVLSPGANSGDVDQSNRSDTYVVSVNENGSTQSVDQSQQGQVGRSGHGSGSGLDQSQEAANTNETEQASEAKATTEQTNVNLPISILEFGSHDRHDGKSHDGKRGHDGHGKGDHDRKGDGYDKDRGHDHGRPDMGRSGDVSQSNSADTSVVSYNANDSVQSIDQIQQGGIGNGSGGSHSGQPRCCA